MAESKEKGPFGSGPFFLGSNRPPTSGHPATTHQAS